MYRNLTPEQRLRRAAEIINKGIYLLAQKEGWFVHSPDTREQKQNQELSTEEHEIIKACKSKGKITNKDLQDLFGIHRNTATARLKDMVSGGLLIQKGNRRHTHYVSNRVL